ncbi:hypothetical protein GCM10009779_35180 [Polymorphospora rubra]|uniref:Uncharacterized protein n=1 Tax=Polymorphospora rubra TaxID=338584 RepID=A0A810NE35_9ACTN|nr:hypothetical protein Prubr_73500 [Polymorphospora rubra]
MGEAPVRAIRVAAAGVALFAPGPPLMPIALLPAALAGDVPCGIGAPWTAIAALTLAADLRRRSSRSDPALGVRCRREIPARRHPGPGPPRRPTLVLAPPGGSLRPRPEALLAILVVDLSGRNLIARG